MIAATLLLLCIVILYLTYTEVKAKVIADFNALQTTVIKLAARGISQRFSQYMDELEPLAEKQAVAINDPASHALYENFFEQEQPQITAITRLDATGKILYTVPLAPSRIGADLSSQEHVKRVLTTHQPVISDVFRAVQGYDAIACHMPVFDDGTFAGSIGILVPFQWIARNYLENVKALPDSNSWVVSDRDVELYCTEQQHIGLPAEQGCALDPALQLVLHQIKQQREGTITFAAVFGWTALPHRIHYQAAYTTVDLDEARWYLITATPETSIIATIAGFRNKLLIMAALVVLLSSIYMYLVNRDWIRTREQEFQRLAAAEKDRLAAKYQQVQKMEAIGRLAAGVAHDFNNLLTPILGYAEILKVSFHDDPENQALADEIFQAGLRARDLTRQLLASGRRQTLEVRPVDINQVLNGVLKLIRRALREDIVLSVVTNAEPCWVMGDKGQLEQVVMNLVVNAQDAMPDGGSLRLATQIVEFEHSSMAKGAVIKPGRYGVLIVTDSGNGMDEATMQNIFEPFFSTKGELGTGLGLATVHGIITQHGGYIDVESTQGQGTTFTIYLPEVQASVSKQLETKLQPKLAVPPEHAQRSQILLVEDDASVRNLTLCMLERSGYRVVTAADAEAALQLLQQHGSGIDLMLTDVIMPGMNGPQLYQTAKQQLPELRVLYMSGYADDALSRDGLLMDGVQLIRKPFSETELCEMLGALLH